MQEGKPKILIMLIDGLGDLSIPQYNNKTPLQHSKTPIFDKLAMTGITGLMDSVAAGYACGSDTSHLNIFGYDPFVHYKYILFYSNLSGRGAFEAEGSGIEMVGGDIGFKCNFAYMEPDTRIVSKRRVDRAFHNWGLELIDSINGLEIPGYEEYTVKAKHATEHRIGLTVSGPGLNNKITDTDPLVDDKKLLEVTATSEEGTRTAMVINALNEAIIQTLSSHPVNLKRIEEGKKPANLILLRGCGQRIEVPNFQEKNNLKSCGICPTAIINGLLRNIGIDIVEVEGATGDYHSDFEAKGRAAVQKLTQEGYDFCFLHIKAIDETGHDRDVDLEVTLLERMDSVMGQIIEGFGKANQDVIISVFGDHTTPPLVGDHTSEAGPIVIGSSMAFLEKKKFVFHDKTERFDEVECAKGLLGRIAGSEILKFLIRLRDNM